MTETFRIFCDDRQINHWREPFWHYCQTNNIQDTTEAITAAWGDFLIETVKEMLNKFIV